MMTDACVNDISGELMSKNQSYKVQITKRDGNVSRDIDVSFEAVESLLRATSKLGWYRLSKNKESGRWDKIPVGTQTEL